jgi:DnaJ-class molecular chaperone
MKRSFYEMLGVPHDADPAQIDTAYAVMTAKLNAANRRGVAETANEVQLIRDGYQILSDPAKRARYDAKLAAAESGVQLMFFPEDRSSRLKLGVQTVLFAALAAALGGIVYSQMTQKIDEVRIEHKQALTKFKEERSKPVSLDPAQSNSNPPDVRIIVKEDEKR